MLFILVGNLNALAPIVTMPFLVTYAAVDYAYFKLAMSYDIKQQQKLLDQARREARHQASQGEQLPTTKLKDDDNFTKISYGTGNGDSGTGVTPEKTEKDDSMEQENSDKDKQDGIRVAMERKPPSVDTAHVEQETDGTLKPTNYGESDTTFLLGDENEEIKHIHISTKERGRLY